jgi:hypothetical protein
VAHGNQKHGMVGTRLYSVWYGMKQRCINPNNISYKWYGAKGVRVCEDWLEFIPFMEWALSNGYTEELTLDRIESGKGYEPGNCRWITQEQNTSRAASDIKRPYVSERNAKRKGSGEKITFNGKSQSITEWAEEIGISRQSLRNRIKRGWSLEKALTKR